MAAQQATGKLNGNTPTVFTGDRDKSEKFLREFDLYWEMNDDHPVMTSPFKRVIAALAFIRGPMVDNWVQDQVTALRQKLTRANPPPLQRTDEALWTEWKAAFTAAFTDTTRQQTAYRQLHELRIKGTDLDTFVPRFKHLATKAGFGINNPATKDLFARALTTPLLNAIIGRETFNPRTATLDNWITAAQAEIQRYENRSAMIPGKWPTQWSSHGLGGKKHHKRSFHFSSNGRQAHHSP